MKYLITIFVIVILYLESQNTMWRFHLVSDLRVFQEVALGRFDPAYLPGGLLFMLVPSLINGGYEQAFILINCVLLFVHFIIYEKIGGRVNSLVFLGILLMSGPILLFRFELLVSVLVLLSVILWGKGKYLISALFLGISVSTKLYPLVLFPYFCLLYLSKKVVLAFAVGVSLPFICLLFAGGSLDIFTISLSSNTLKPIGVESVPATILTVASMVTNGLPPKIYLGGGVWGLVEGANSAVLSVLVFLIMAGFYAIMFLKNGIKKFSIGAVYFLVLVFLFFSKNLNPQYLYWFILIFPLVKYTEKGRKDYCVLAVLIMAVSLFNQLIYPVFFTEFLNFFAGGVGNWVFYINLLKNVSLLALVVLSFRYIFVTKSIE